MYVMSMELSTCLQCMLFEIFVRIEHRIWYDKNAWRSNISALPRMTLSIISWPVNSTRLCIVAYLNYV